MPTNKCRVCGTETIKTSSAKILFKYKTNYCHCPNCRFLQTEYPTWLNEAYAESINVTDTGIMARNTLLTEITTVLVCLFYDKSGKFLDYGGGYGIGTRMMRDIGLDFCWQDPNTENIFARGFEYLNQKKPIELVTVYECFEHFVEPVKEIDRILKISRNIIFSTELLPSPVPKPKDWWYYGLEHGQHVSFYSKETLLYIAKSNGLNYYNYGTIHLFTTKKINARLFSFAIQRKSIFFWWAAKRLKSKTLEDMRLLIKRTIK